MIDITAIALLIVCILGIICIIGGIIFMIKMLFNKKYKLIDRIVLSLTPACSIFCAFDLLFIPMFMGNGNVSVSGWTHSYWAFLFLYL